MKEFFERVQALVVSGDIRISEHGYDELADDNLTVKEILTGVPEAVSVEYYPDYHKGPCILLLQHDRTGSPIHVVWGIPMGYNSPVVLITAYRPDPVRWDDSYTRRL